MVESDPLKPSVVWRKRLIVTALILIFVIIAPLLVFYAKGYRYDFEEKRVKRVGIIVISHEPRDATTFVDGSEVPLLDSFLGVDRMRDLLPGQYGVEVKKEGYQTWSKTLDVKPELAAWARYVILFKESPEKKEIFELESPPELIENARDGSKIAVVHSESSIPNIEVLEMEDGGSLKVFSEGSIKLKSYSIPEIKWNEDSSGIIIKAVSPKKAQRIFYKDLSGSNDEVREIEYPERIDLIQANPDNRSAFFILSEKGIREYNTVSGETRDITGRVQGFGVAGDNLMMAKLPDPSPYVNQAELNLVRANLNGEHEEILATNLPKSSLYEFDVSEDGRVAVKDFEGNLYIVRDDKLVHRIAERVRTFKWAEDADREDKTDEMLAFNTEHEILVYDSAIENVEQITRFEEPIEQIEWLKRMYKHILFIVNGQLKVIELDEKGGRITNDLYKQGESLSGWISQDKKGENVFLFDGTKLTKLGIR